MEHTSINCNVFNGYQLYVCIVKILAHGAPPTPFYVITQGFTEDGGYIVLFEDSALVRKALAKNCEENPKRYYRNCCLNYSFDNRFLIRLYSSQCSDARSLVQFISRHHKNLGQNWMVLRFCRSRSRHFFNKVFFERAPTGTWRVPNEA